MLLWLPGHGATISGTLPALKDSYVTLYRYTDLVVYNTTPPFDIYTDSTGHFEYHIDVTGTERFKITTETGAVTFYCTGEKHYTLSDQNGKLVVSGNSPDINTLLPNINKDLAVWRKSFCVDSTKFRKVKAPAGILQTLTTIKSKYHTNDSAINNELGYYFAGAALFFITNSYTKSDAAGARKQSEAIERTYINGKPVWHFDPFYMELLDGYVGALAHNPNFELSKSGGFAARLQDMSHFKNDTLKELAEVFVIKNYYTNKWYKDEGQTIEQFDDKVRQVRSGAALGSTKQYIQQLVARGNKIGKGIKFPVITLPNEFHRPVDITQVHSPYTLVNFWATWSTTSKEQMRQFITMQEKYKDKLTIICISIDDNEAAMRDYLAGLHYDTKWPNLYNGDHGKYVDRLQLDAMPASYLLDADKRIISMPRPAELASELKKCIK